MYVFELTMCMSEIKLVSWISTLSKACSVSFKFLLSFTFKMTEFFEYYKARVVKLMFSWNYICIQYFHEMTIFAMVWLIYNAANVVKFMLIYFRNLRQQDSSPNGSYNVCSNDGGFQGWMNLFPLAFYNQCAIP